MDIVKKNIVSIVCGVVALVCLIVVFWPLGPQYSHMTDDVKASKDIGDKLTTLQTAPRTWPTLSTDDKDKKPLTDFPTEADVQEGTKITQGWTAKVQALFDAYVRVQTDALKPLVPGALPKATSLALSERFKTRYAEVMNLTLGSTGATPPPGGGMAPPPFPGGGFGGSPYGGGMSPRPPGSTPGQPTGGPPKPLLDTPLVGRMPPADDEIRAKADEREAEVRRTRTQISQGQVQNQAQVDAEVFTERSAVGDRLRDEVARQSMIYVDPTTAFVAQDRILITGVPVDTDVFMAQVGLWLQQEICRSIYDVNKPALDSQKDAKGQSQGVLVVPIKHLIGVRFTLPYNPPAPPAPGTPAPTDVPTLPATPPAAKVAQDFGKNPLGQVSNDLYDVLPFNMVLVCEADTVPKTLDSFGQGRYMTIRAVDVQTVDSAVAAAHGFIYGTKPVVQVTVHGQYLLLRKFLGPYMPADIIRGILAPPPAQPG